MNFPVIKKYISTFTSPKTKMVVLISCLEILIPLIKKDGNKSVLVILLP